MSGLEDFRLGARVVDTDGEPAGELVGVLLNEDGFEPRSIVVKNSSSLVGRLIAAEKLFVTDEVVVPLSKVVSATHEVVKISITGAELRRQEPYVSYRFKPMSFGEALLREAQLLGGGLAMPDVEEVAAEPSGSIEIDRDEDVMLRESGRRLGKVHELLFDEGKLIGVVVRPDGLFKEDVVLPSRFLSRGDGTELVADLAEPDVASLKRFEEPLS